MNNYLCAPNRMYLSINLGVPVIVGANPTMKNIADKFECGVALEDFGESAEGIEKAIDEMNQNYQGYRNATKEISKFFNWNDQDNVIESVLSV